MKLGWNDKEETFEYAIKINRCIEFIYKRKHYWIDTFEGRLSIFYNSKVISTYDDADDFLKNANIEGLPIIQVIEQSHILSY